VQLYIGLSRTRAARQVHSQRSLQQRKIPIQEASMSIRPVKRLIKSKPTLDSAGVHLRRVY